MPSISGFLEEQGSGLNFEQMLEQASEQIRAIMKGFALPPNRPTQRVLVKANEAFFEVSYL
jgi:hypothetical protein